MTAVAVPARGEQWVAGSRAVNMLACEEAADQTNSSTSPAFRSKAVAPESPTPYTDATQVRHDTHVLQSSQIYLFMLWSNTYRETGRKILNPFNGYF